MKAFLMTWSSSRQGSRIDNLLAKIEGFRNGKQKTLTWRMMAHTQSQIGDRVFFFKQGKGERGIFGHGKIIGDPFSEKRPGDKLPKYYVPIKLHDFRNPQEELLIPEHLIRHLVKTNVQGSGTEIANGSIAQLENLLKSDPFPVNLDPISEKQNSTRWTINELEAAVNAYDEMLKHEQQGMMFSKTQYGRQFSAIFPRRSIGSFEWRMQNVSFVLKSLGLPTLAGYVPAANVGGNSKLFEIVKTKYAQLQISAIVTSDEKLLDQEVARLMKTHIPTPTEIPRVPNTQIVHKVVYERNASIKGWILQNAKGYCEGCNHPAPFYFSAGHGFLEVHHVKSLATGGTDSLQNAVALCPNCHRRCHYSIDHEEYTNQLYERVPRLVRE